MPKAPVYDLFINQGSTLLITVTLKTSAGAPLDITGSSFAGQIRQTATAATALQALTLTKLTPYASGRFSISLTAIQTAALSLIPNTGPQNIPTVWCYDIEKTDGSTVVRVLQGEAIVSPEVTR